MAQQELPLYNTTERAPQVQGERPEDVVALLGTTLKIVPEEISLKQCKRGAQKRCASSRKLFVHVVCCCLLTSHLVAFFSYLAFKAMLYTRHLKEVVTTAPWLLVLLLCECFYFTGNVLSAIADHFLPPSVRPDLCFELQDENRKVRQSKPDNQDANGFLDDSDVPLNSKIHVSFDNSCPRVDILITCCKEPTDILQDTIKAALALDYPFGRMRVLVLDDGGDDDLKVYCQALQTEAASNGLVYLRREKIPGTPHHFKCGNLNYGLKNSDAEYVVILDADMILHESYLRKVFPHIIEDEEVSFVQVPQYFYNLAKGDPLNDASVFNYEKVLVHRDSIGIASSIGTGAIFRRAHLDLIGGFQSHSITEDTTTSFALFNMGFKSVYLPAKLQMGLTPWSLEAYIKQRQRWGTGAFQQFSSTYKTMLGPTSNLNFTLKVCFIWHTVYYYLSIVNIIWLSTFLVIFGLGLPISSIGGPKAMKTMWYYLSLTLVLWRITWYCLWLEVPNSLQSRNRDESQFWWMTPYYFSVVVKAIFSYERTFKFVTTFSIDQTKTVKEFPLLKILKKLKHVYAHLIFVLAAGTATWLRFQFHREDFQIADSNVFAQVMGMSLFLVATWAHMIVPIMHILWPTSQAPERRKSLLKYTPDGTPVFDAAICEPRLHWPIMLYETLSLANLLFWSAVLYESSR
ncbi:hypothetical protein KP509_13G082800 [Ceratopteris richardii]|uniref:Glycosyltransferase 2-like domain-containing protein n=1 Tax=Ceratopteris richardii TaxID=49495 RepID=A0A8T2TKN6_CERRI|nr:hypothetical protein KP509_13G082800 [Ceratopteris richardii]